MATGIRTTAFVATLLGATFWSQAASAVSGTVRGTAYAHSPTSFTESAAIGPTVAGVQVSIAYCRAWILVRGGQSFFWQCNSFGSSSTTTDVNGAYTLSYTDAVNPPSGATGNVMTFYAGANAGDEVLVPAPIKTIGTGATGKDYKRVALMRSPNSAVWLRRYGTGDYPFFFVEGFDPQNNTRTGDEQSGNSTKLGSPSILRIMRNSPIGSATVDPDTLEAPAGATNNMLDFLIASNYSVYVVASGRSWKNPQAGTLADHSDGMAYQAMTLVKQAQQRFSPTATIIVGGYSLGGSVVRTGLVHWCNGDFAGIAGSPLLNGCPEVGLWWAADAPLDAATVPESLMRLMKDTQVVGKPLPRAYVESMDSGAARELVETWVTGGCTTGCTDEDGCVSALPAFNGGCTVDASARVAFQNWNGMPAGRLTNSTHSAVQNGMPKRGTTLVPAVAFTMGRSPTLGFLPDSPPRQVNGEKRFMYVHISGSGSLFGFQIGSVSADIELFAKPEETRTGSRMNVLRTIQTKDSSSYEWPGAYFGGWGIYTEDSSVTDPFIDFLPTFVPARSSLLWSSAEPAAPLFWKDLRMNSTDADHFSPFPNEETGMILAWASEFAKGYRTAPVATPLKTPNWHARSPSVEWVDARDDDGDEEVDEMQVWDGMGLTATWTDASNRWLTFVSQNRYWKYDSLEDQFIPQTGYFGQANYVPDVPAGNASTWFNAPLVDGMKPWDGPYGITAAYTAPATGDWFGPAQHIVLFNQNRYWVYRGGDDGDQSWMAAGHVGDALWIPQVFPYFEASYTPTLNGYYPWDQSGITGIHYNEWGRTDQIAITSEGRQWTYNLMDGTWSTPWERSGIPSAAWTTYDRSVQCIASNNPCAYLDCGSTPYWQGGFTHASCFATDGGWTHLNTFDISTWGSQIAVVRNGITNIQSFTPASGASCPAGIAGTIQSACNGKQICNYPLPQGCAGTARYTCASYNVSDYGQVTATSGGTLGMPCPW